MIVCYQSLCLRFPFRIFSLRYIAFSQRITAIEFLKEKKALSYTIIEMSPHIDSVGCCLIIHKHSAGEWVQSRIGSPTVRIDNVICCRTEFSTIPTVGEFAVFIRGESIITREEETVGIVVTPHGIVHTYLLRWHHIKVIAWWESQHYCNSSDWQGFL